MVICYLHNLLAWEYHFESGIMLTLLLFCYALK